MEDRPKSLKDEAEQIAREQMLRQEHILPLTRFVDEVLEEYPDKDIPYFDPLDGGIVAQCLFVLESPGRKATRRFGSGFVSRNNNDEIAKNFFKVNDEAGIQRQNTVTWNIIPWDISKDGIRQTPSSSEIEIGLKYLYRLIDRLPNLRVIVLVGEKAKKVGMELSAIYNDIRIFPCPHPSPLNVNTNQQNRQKIIDALKRVKEFLDDLT